MSGADTIRDALNIGDDEPRGALAALDALVAENQRLRDALADIRNAVHDEQWSSYERLQAISDWSSAALDRTP